MSKLFRYTMSVVIASTCFLATTFAMAAEAVDCQPVLVKAQYKEAARRHVYNAFLKIIDRDSWDVMRGELGETGSFFGVLPVGGSYEAFDNSRDEYLESQHYTRSSDEAVSVFGDPSKYSVYRKCLRRSDTGSSRQQRHSAASTSFASVPGGETNGCSNTCGSSAELSWLPQKP